MGIYGDRVLPHLLDACGSLKAVEPLRKRVCEQLHGHVLELGFGSGLNLPHYPAAVTAVDAVEPSDVGWKIAGRRRAAARIPVRRSALDGQALPFPDHSFDTALTTFTLCTIPDPSTALREVRRVLRPGGTLHFLEHGLAPDEDVRRWQRRLEPLQKRVFGGCHLTRPVVDLLTTSGFAVTDLDTFYERGAPKAVGAQSLGIAVPTLNGG
jgi:ubiquinone/menaquinone biosynthesis C-methylase UbiE